MTDPLVPLVLELKWVKQRRDRGGTIWILDQTGTSWHADAGLADLLGREGVPDNGLSAFSAGHAEEAQAMFRRWFGRDMKARIPIEDDVGAVRWFDVEVHWINVFVVLALWASDAEGLTVAS